MLLLWDMFLLWSSEDWPAIHLKGWSYLAKPWTRDGSPFSLDPAVEGEFDMEIP
jgi:hypothetical protein